MSTVIAERATLCEDKLLKLKSTDERGCRLSDRVLVGTLDDDILIGQLCELDGDAIWIDGNAETIYDVFCWRELPRMY